MKFICSQKKFLEAILTVQRATTIRTTHPILEGAYIETCNDMIKIVCTDLKLGIESYIEAHILEEGSIVVPARLLSEIIRKLPDADVEITVSDKNKVRIRCLNSLISIQGQEPDEFPKLPLIEEKDPIEIDQITLSDMIRQTTFAVAVDEARPILTGALIEVEDREINIVCLDGYRVAYRKGTINNKQKYKSVVVPGKSLNEVSKIVCEEGSKVNIIITDKHILFDMGYTRIISRIQDGDYINYRQIIPSDYNTRVKIDMKVFSDSIERASLIARDGKNNLIKFTIDDQRLVITSNSETGQIFEEIPIILEGKEIEVAFNARYFLDIVKAIDEPEVCLDFTTNVSPCVIRPIEGDDYIYLLLPVRLFV